MEEQRNSCLNCKYFCQHFVKVNEIKFQKIFFGHCKKIASGKTMKYPYKSDCRLWERKKDGEAERDKNIKKVLTRMAKQVMQIAAVIDGE